MFVKLDTTLDYFVLFIILIKFIFIISTFSYAITSRYNNSIASDIDPTLLYLKQRSEFIFIISMAILMIYHFNPYLSKKPIISDTINVLFFLFGFILIITADWGLFITDSEWHKILVSSVT